MKSVISYDDFQKLDIRIVTILAVEPIEGADRLYKITLDAGKELGERTIAAGIKAWYAPEQLIGKQVPYLANLEPRKLRGVMSQGMLLAGDHDGAVLLNPDKVVPAGSNVK